MAVVINGSGPVTGVTTLASPTSINGLTLPTDSLQPGMPLVAQQTFTGVSSVSFNNCFTSNYDNYSIHFMPTAFSNTAATALNLRLRVSGVDKSDSLYYYGGLDVNTSGGSGARYANPTTAINTANVSGSYPTMTRSIINVFQPLISTVNTGFTWHGFQSDGTSAYSTNAGGTYYANVALDGFSLYPASGTMTGTVRVYGYRNS